MPSARRRSSPEGEDSVKSFVYALIHGDKRAAAKLISLIEDDQPTAADALALIHPHTGRAHVVGFTGPPGVGKSSLINRLLRADRAKDRRVSVVAVDPTSPFTGGAVLGDRIRMADLGTDPGVFIRSMATRGHAGGLALATFDAVRVLDAMGSDVVFVETVGAGQSEVEIATRAHTTVVVEMPLTGDSVQVMKVGLLEVGDVYVVNKTDLGNWEGLVGNLKFQIEPRNGWTPPIVKTSATENRGIDELVEAIDSHLGYLRSSGAWEARNRDRAKREILENAQRLLSRQVEDFASLGKVFDRLTADVSQGRLDPQSAARELIASASRTRARRTRLR